MLPMARYAPPQGAANGMLVLGEAPGAEEIRHNQPFVGRSGKLLTQALAEAGIDRAACYIANVFRWQPPDNKVGHFFRSRRAAAADGEALAEAWGAFGSGWCRAAYAAGPEEARQTILAVAPRVLVAVGRVPLWLLTGESGIVALAGQWRPCRFAPDIPVLATYHPSYILRGKRHLLPEWVEHWRAARLAASLQQAA
jgi:uracil-DNA glycosylase